MRREAVCSIILLVLAPGLAGCLDRAPPIDETVTDPLADMVDESGFAPRLTAGWVYETFEHDLDATIRMHAEVFLPDPARVLADATLPDRYPTILVVSPYLGDGFRGLRPASPLFSYLVESLVPRGYAAAFIGSASTGGTGGCWDFMGPIDQAVAVGAVRAVQAQPWSDGTVGMIGVSYDAMTQVMAASHAIDGLVTIVPIAPLTHAYGGLYQGGIHYGGGWMTTTTGYHLLSALPPWTNPPRLHGWAQGVALTPTCAGQNTIFGNDPTGRYNEYYQARDFRPAASGVTASVFLMHGFLDANTKPDNPFPWFNDLESPKKLWLGHWAHSPANATWAGREDMYVTLHRWFDHWLKGIPNGMDAELGVDVQDSTGRWRHEAEWPPADAAARRLYLESAEALAWEPAGASTVSFGGAASLLDGDGVALRSEPFTEGLLLAGAPTLTIRIESDRAGGQVIAELYVERADGQRRLATRGGLNLLAHDGLENTSPVLPLAPITARITLYPTDFVIDPGTTLVLILRTNDATEWYAPDAHGATLTAHLGSDTYLELPTVDRSGVETLFTACGSLLSDWSPCFHSGRKDVR